MKPMPILWLTAPMPILCLTAVVCLTAFGIAWYAIPQKTVVSGVEAFETQDGVYCVRDGRVSGFACDFSRRTK